MAADGDLQHFVDMRYYKAKRMYIEAIQREEENSCDTQEVRQIRNERFLMH